MRSPVVHVRDGTMQPPQLLAGDEIKHRHLVLPATLRTLVCHDLNYAAPVVLEKGGDDVSHVEHPRDVHFAPRAADGACRGDNLILPAQPSLDICRSKLG